MLTIILSQTAAKVPSWASTLGVILLLTLLAFGAGIYLKKQKDQGKSGCGCGCSACGSADQCRSWQQEYARENKPDSNE